MHHSARGLSIHAANTTASYWGMNMEVTGIVCLVVPIYNSYNLHLGSYSWRLCEAATLGGSISAGAALISANNYIAHNHASLSQKAIDFDRKH